MKNAVVIAFLSLAMLSGCAAFDKIQKGSITEKSAKIDPKLLQACAKLPLSAANSPEAVLADEYLTTIELYGLCKKKQDDSIKVIKELANIKD